MKALPKNWLSHAKNTCLSLLNQKTLTCLLVFAFYGGIAQNIYRFAGTGFLGNTPDGNLANGNPIGNPYGMCADNSGNIYFVEGGGVIRKINSSGFLSTVAGPGTLNVIGDGGPATSAFLNYVEGIAIDAAGNIYVADQMNNRIRKINSSGIINTIAGTGTAGFSGDGGSATYAQISYPQGITIDLSGNIYFTEASHRVRKIDPSGIISTIAGNGTAGFSGDGGPAISAQVNTPIGITTDAAGNIYFSDSLLHTIRKINTSGIISTFASLRVRNLVCDAAGNIYSTYGDVKKINPLGVISTFAGNGTPGNSGDGGPATSAQVGLPYGIALDPGNNVYFGQQGQAATNQCIRVVCQSSCFAGINENRTENDLIRIYPNPVSGYLFISSEQYFEEGDEIEITNALGQIALSSKYKNEIDVSSLPSGVYILQLSSKNQVAQKRLIIAK